MKSTYSLNRMTELEPGDHLCFLYETGEEHRAVITSFLRLGLERGEKVLYIVDSYTSEVVIGYLRDDGVEAEPYLASGQLSILGVDETNIREGIFDPDEMIALLRSETEKALTEGYRALRITGEMTWVLRDLAGSARLIEYEATLNKFFPESKCSAICQYDRRRFDPDVLLDVLATHPIAIIGTGIFDNFYYIPPKDFLGNDPEAAKLKHWLDSLVERKRAEDARCESEEKYRDLVENINDVIFATDVNGAIAYISPAIESFIGYHPSELIGRNLTEFIHQEELPRVREQVKKILSGEFKPSEYRILTKSDEIRWVRTSSRPIFEGTRCIGFRGALTDITESKLLQTQLQHAQKMEAIGTLAGGIAHDFNNILAAILGFTEIALLDIPEESPVRHNLEQAIKAGNRAKELVKQIFVFSRHGDQGKKPIQISPIVKETLKLLRSSLPSTVEIRQKIETTTESSIMANLTQIHQILTNLCTNGAHAMREKGGVLEISLCDLDLDPKAVVPYPDLNPGPYVKLTVSDTGHGMGEEVIERIYDPYFTTKGVGEGSGMGLSMIHGMMKSSGGTISVSSEPGKGTTFDVFFPRIEKEEKSETDAITPLPGGKGRILFVDDEAVLVQVGKQMLKHLGYEVVAKNSSVEALEAFREQPNRFDLVITDQTMPNMTGAELTKELIGIRPDIPIILCTGLNPAFGEMISPEEAKTLGIKEVIIKPIALRNLAETIRRSLH